jgi:DNA-binding transcriptional MerR regulator
VTPAEQASAASYTTAAAAEYLGRSPATLRWWRSKGLGPKFTGRRSGVRYRKRDLDAWLDANTHTATR